MPDVPSADPPPLDPTPPAGSLPHGVGSASAAARSGEPVSPGEIPQSVEPAGGGECLGTSASGIPLDDRVLGERLARDLALRARELAEEEPLPPVRRRVVIPAILFLATCASTFFVGASRWNPAAALEHPEMLRILTEKAARTPQHWTDDPILRGLAYMGALMGILVAHEMGHFVTALIHRIPASFPIFIPIPFNAIGTMGAVIGVDGLRANRRQMFDLGISGPLAGLALAVPILWLGIEWLDLSRPAMGVTFHNPWIIRLMIEHLRPELADQAATISLNQLNPFIMAGWVAMLITGLNMLPISQLDGGHVVYSLFGQRAHTIARGFVVLSILYIIVTQRYFWTMMLILVILMGADHPPTADDEIPLGRWRWILGLASLAIPILCFAPEGVDPTPN